MRALLRLPAPRAAWRHLPRTPCYRPCSARRTIGRSPCASSTRQLALTARRPTCAVRCLSQWAETGQRSPNSKSWKRSAEHSTLPSTRWWSWWQPRRTSSSCSRTPQWRTGFSIEACLSTGQNSLFISSGGQGWLSPPGLCSLRSSTSSFEVCQPICLGTDHSAAAPQRLLLGQLSSSGHGGQARPVGVPCFGLVRAAPTGRRPAYPRAGLCRRRNAAGEARAPLSGRCGVPFRHGGRATPFPFGAGAGTTPASPSLAKFSPRRIGNWVRILGIRPMRTNESKSKAGRAPHGQ
jgi:hypothetical protein